MMSKKIQGGDMRVICFCGNDIFDETKSGALFFISCPCCGLRGPGYLTSAESWSMFGFIQGKIGGYIGPGGPYNKRKETDNEKTEQGRKESEKVSRKRDRQEDYNVID